MDPSTSLYRQYKRQTKHVTSWLATTAASCNCPTSLLQLSHSSSQSHSAHNLKNLVGFETISFFNPLPVFISIVPIVLAIYMNRPTMRAFSNWLFSSPGVLNGCSLSRTLYATQFIPCESSLNSQF